jgi:hypothetical protein
MFLRNVCMSSPCETVWMAVCGTGSRNSGPIANERKAGFIEPGIECSVILYIYIYRELPTKRVPSWAI